jgi:hypothetical protein
MKSDRDLSRLFQYASKTEWSRYLEEVLHDHFQPAKVEFDIEHAEIVELLGEHWALNLWSFVFEDLLTREFGPDGANLADDYLKRRGWRETPGAKSYIRALRTAVMSLYEVSEVIPGRSFLARDLIRGGEPVLVSEKSATQTLKAWDRIAARILTIGGRRILAVAVLPFTMEGADNLIEAVRKAAGKRSRRAKLAIDDRTLGELSHAFTTAWLVDVLPNAMGRKTPRLHNYDGDEVVFHTVRFALMAKATQNIIVSKLDAMPDLQKDDAGLWSWVGEPGMGRPQADGQPEALRWNVTMQDRTVVLGTIALKDRALVLSANSAARAANGAQMLQGVLTELVRTPLTQIQTIDQVRESAAGAPPSKQIPLEVATQLVHGVLDEPVPMLGDRSPRQAARTPAGREKLVPWLKFLENRSGSQVDPTDPMATYDFGGLWRELGVENLRR